MSANTKIVVLRRKELLYTGIFAALGVLFIILLLMLLLPGKDTDASYGTPDSPDDTAAEMPDNVADVFTGAVADTGNTYIPGIYTTELILGSETVNVEVIVSDHAITSVSLADPSETLTTMYPLLESTMESLNDQLCEMQDPSQVTYSAETRYTSLVLLEAVKASLERQSLRLHRKLPLIVPQPLRRKPVKKAQNLRRCRQRILIRQHKHSEDPAHCIHCAQN